MQETQAIKLADPFGVFVRTSGHASVSSRARIDLQTVHDQGVARAPCRQSRVEFGRGVPALDSCDLRCHVAESSQTARAQSSRSPHIEVRGKRVDWLEGLQILADRLPWIETLSLDWTSSSTFEAESQVLARLQRLKSLRYRAHKRGLTEEHLDHFAIAENHFLQAVSRLPELESLKMELLHERRVLFSQLVELTRLRALDITVAAPLSAVPSAEQVAALRQMHTLERFSVVAARLQARTDSVVGSRQTLCG